MLDYMEGWGGLLIWLVLAIAVIAAATAWWPRQKPQP
jgi:hypothetical protein